MKVMTATRSFAVTTLLFLLAAVNAFADTVDFKVSPENDKVEYYYRGMGWYDKGWNAPSTVDSVDYWYGSPSQSWHKAYLDFELGVLPASDLITKATFNFNLLSVNSPGDAGAANLYYNGNHILNIKDQAIGWVSTDITDLLKNDRANGVALASFRFDWVGYGDWGPSSGITFSGGLDSVNAAYLRVTTTPEPLSAGLFLLGGAGLAVLRRRKA